MIKSQFDSLSFNTPKYDRTCKFKSFLCFYPKLALFLTSPIAAFAACFALVGTFLIAKWPAIQDRYKPGIRSNFTFPPGSRVKLI